MTRRLRVVSYQLSGVAWVPWRVGRCLAAAGGEVEYVAAGPGPDGLESYGLPGIDLHGPFEAVLRSTSPDVVHLHHDCAAQALLEVARRVAPRARTLVTLHGEPDRSRGRVGRVVPDGYHAVEPGLLELAGVGAARLARWLPNHPGILPDVPRPGRARRVYRPHSHVPSFKDWDVLDAEAESLRARGYELARAPGIVRNAAVREQLATSAGAWVQRRGYLDILTMEACQLGAAPIVELSAERLDQWSAALGFEPRLVRGWAPGELGAALDEFAGGGLADHNLAGMRDAWTPAACGARWARLYHELFATA